MSPVIKKKGERFTLPSKYLLFVFTVICCVAMLLSFGTDVFNIPLNTAVGYLIVPFQEGISKTGSWLSDRSEELVQIRQLIEENEALKGQVADLTAQNTVLQQERYELTRLRELLDLKEKYNQYDSVGARIISRDSGNWYSNFIVDKGYEDGIAVDMNVMAGGGLAGRVTSVGPNWAKVTTIISDDSNVSGAVMPSGNTLIVSGDLQLIRDGVIRFSQLLDEEGQVEVGSKVVTSSISDKFLSDILIGYIDSITLDANNLTKSGQITPVVDFGHLEEVLIITQRKPQIREDEALE